jgi:hypothetical protein
MLSSRQVRVQVGERNGTGGHFVNVKYHLVTEYYIK